MRYYNIVSDEEEMKAAGNEKREKRIKEGSL
jgi:hypothetical protein